MSLLLYFVARAGTVELPTVPGVRGAEMANLDLSNLAAFHSVLASLPDDPNLLAEEGVRFFKVQQAAFAKGTIVPFRFPSIFPDESALLDFISKNSDALTAALSRVESMSQFDIRISAIEPTSPAETGTDYLRTRARQSAAISRGESRCRELLSDIAREWIVRDTPARTTLHVLVPRADEEQTAARFRQLEPPSDYRLVVLGPWPPGAFVGDSLQKAHD